MNIVQKLDTKVRLKLKYYQGFGDAFAGINSILLTMAKKVQEHPDKAVLIVAKTIKSIAEIWEETNNNANKYIDAISTGINYNPDTEYLEVDEDTGEVRIQKH